MGLFSNIKQAQYSEGGVWILSGVYRAQILRCKVGRTRMGKDFFVIELRVLESNNQKRPPGSDMSHMITLDKEPAMGNVKQFVSVAAEVKMEDVDEAGVEAIVAEANPLKGTIVRISAIEIPTKKGSPFTKVKYIPDEEGEAGATAAQTQDKKDAAADGAAAATPAQA